MSQPAEVELPVNLPIAAAEPTGDADRGVETSQQFRWTPLKLCWSILLFVLAAAAEVGGGWLVWQSIRTGRPWWWGLLGAVVLVIYGFIPTLQPVDHFGRTFAVYGGFFIVYSYAWGWLLDGERPDTGDFAGAGIALAGVSIVWFWPRKSHRL
ncbi:hypothetical protein ABBQ38_011859 [Trebouxia sp. C0009 RCD-2024]